MKEIYLENSEKTEKNQKIERKKTHLHRKEISQRKKHLALRREMFADSSIPEDSRKIIEDFDKIVAGVRGMSGKQKFGLYGAIKNLSNQLTNDRSSRRLGYMNDAGYVSAYINYFMWWNIVRLARLFSNFPKNVFDFLENSENPVCIDVGSGTLTVVSALWLARPELRKKNLSWYCMDLSQTALSVGEDLYLSIAAKTMTDEANPWKIIRVRGEFGTAIKEKADFITCANVFNEILQRNEMPTDFLAKKYTAQLISYLKSEKTSVLLVEPGDPHSARFITLMRDALIRQNFLPVAPCPHSETCPMAGRTNGRTTNLSGKNVKWCNFAFATEFVPERLLKLSEKVGLPKERASLSFVIAKKNDGKSIGLTNDSLLDSQNEETIFIRIASDFIRLPNLHKSGYYACSKFGLLLAIDENHIQPKNGELLQIKIPADLTERDKKSGALIVKI